MMAFNPLLSLPPELAHKLALFAVRFGLAGGAKRDPALRKTVAGLSFPSPVGLSAGADKDAVALAGWSKLGFGFIEAGTVTLHPRSGNPAPRIWRQKQERSVINWMGLPGGGLDVFLGNLKRFRASAASDLVVGVSVTSPEGQVEDLKTLAQACAPYADYFTLNASCPNVTEEEHGSDPLQSIKDHVSAVCAGADGKPVFLKLGPTRDAPALIATLKAAQEAGAQGFVLTNTVPPALKEMIGAALPFDWPQADGQAVGGYSGPRLLDTTAFMIKTAREALGANVPLIGVGGIQSADDAQKIITAGADLVQIYTGFIYHGPRLVHEINHHFAQPQ